jgi:hypothetical protein
MISDVGDACRREPRQKAWVAWQMKSPEISGSNSMFSAGYGGSQAQQITRATEDCGREMCLSGRVRDPPVVRERHPVITVGRGRKLVNVPRTIKASGDFSPSPLVPP